VVAVNDYGLQLFDHHARLLADSAISVEVARERGYRTASARKELGSRGFSSGQQNVPGLLIPVHDETGAVALHQYRPDEPRVTKAGKAVKYETPAKTRMVVDVPPRVRGHLGDPSRPLWITEGIRKADAAVTVGLDCLALLGVWNWRGRNDYEASTALAFWESVALTDRRVYVCFDSDVMLKRSVHTALCRLGAFLARRGAKVAYAYLPSGDGGKVGLDDYLAAGGTVPELVRSARSEPIEPPDPEPGPEPDAPARPSRPAAEVRAGGAALLGEIRAFLARFVVFPSEHALDAATLWVAHTHALDAAESTPRIAHLSPEPASGKTRALEVYDLLVPHPMHAVNATPAALFRSVKDLAHRPTILFDEIDTVFGPKAKENEEIRGLLNAGHRRGAVAYRCVGEGTNQRVEPFPAYAAVALAGLGDLPDTILSRSVVIRMRRRAPHERVEPFRRRVHAPQGHLLRDRLAQWAAAATEDLSGAWPAMPDGITDRPADLWEPLLAVADAAGGGWPGRAHAACVALVRAQSTDSGSLGVRLLADLRAVFGNADALPTETILKQLHGIEDGPWAELGKQCKPLDSRGLARRLKPYGVGPHQFRDPVAGKQRGYSVAGTEGTDSSPAVGGLGDAWARYLPPLGQGSGTRGTAGTAEHPDRSATMPGVPNEDRCTGTSSPSGTDTKPATSAVPDVPDVPDPPAGDADDDPALAAALELGAAPTDPSVVCEDCGQSSGWSLLGGRCRRCQFTGRRAAAS